MKNMSLAAIAGALVFALPALADTTPPTGTPSAEQQCHTERAQMGVDTFRQTYGTNKNHHNAFAKCVSKRTDATDQNESEAHSNAAEECKTLQGDHGNAFGKCVSQHAQEQTADATRQDIQADVNAAKGCKAERKADPAAFATKYGTNKNHRNAFGKCVSQHAKAEQEQESGTS